MSTWAMCETRAPVNNEGICLNDAFYGLNQEPDWEMFVGDAKPLTTQAPMGIVGRTPHFDDFTQNVPLDELSSHRLYASPDFEQTYSSTDGSDTPFLTPSQTCTESGSPIAVAEEPIIEPSTYSIEPSQSYLAHSASAGGSPSASLQDGFMSGQMHSPFAMQEASAVTATPEVWLGVTPHIAQRHDGLAESSSDHGGVPFRQLQTQFQDMTPLGQVYEPMATPGPAFSYQYSTSYVSQWSESGQTLISPTDFVNRSFQHGSASIGTQFDSQMDVDRTEIQEVTGAHGSVFVGTQSPYRRFEVPRLVSYSSLSHLDHGHCVSPQSAPLQVDAHRSDNVIDSFCDRAVSHVAQPANRPAAPTGVIRHRSRLRVAEPTMTTITSMRGGRTSGLSPVTREGARLMRAIGACWPCKILKETCDYTEGASCCSRCEKRGPRLTKQLFGECVRTKMSELMNDFLPSPVGYMHQIQIVKKEMQQNVDDRGFLGQDIMISLSIGFGPPLSWNLREFIPQKRTFLKQSQYIQSSKSGKSILIENWSPPLGIKQFDNIAIAEFEHYLEQLLQPKVLKRLGANFYRAESKMDRNAEKFQATLLQLMCDLYINSNDDQLQTILTKILRMLLVTYIMAHVLTIQRSTIEGVMRSMQYAELPEDVKAIKHISPRLANQQFKCHFSKIRARLYGDLLRDCQKVLSRNAENITESTWIQSFCIMLGFAMVLEEIQHTLYIQSDASITKGATTRTQAERQCSDFCQRIDERFALLTGLHQSKYRSIKKFAGSGSFGPGTPDLKDDASRIFAYRVRQLAKSRFPDLQDRANVKPLPENHHLFTTRLTAKFLLSFGYSPYA